MQPAWASGRAATVLGWLEWLADEDLLDRYPTLTVHGALHYALLGLPAQAEVWAAAAERSTTEVELHDGSSQASLLAYMRAFLCRDGVEAMRADSIASYDGLSPTSPYRTSMLFAEGLSHLLDDEPEQAEPILVRSADAAVAIGADPVAAMVLTVLGTIAADREDWDDAKEIGDRALQFLAGGATDEYWTAALVFAFGARLAVHADRLDLARDRLTRAARLRPLLTYALPVVSTMALIEMARVYVALADPAGRRGGPAPGPWHPPAASRARPPRTAGRGVARAARRRGRRPGRRIVVDGRRAPPGPAAGDAPHAPGDRRAPLHRPEHGQDPSHLHLPQARRDVPP